MDEHTSPTSEIHIILAADQRCGSVSPQDDHIWELTSAQGEPPGLALHTTFGLRAYSIRIYPRFTYRNHSLSDPHTFSKRPVIDFSAANFASMKYSPFNELDVSQKVWVPDSHTLVGQVSLHNPTDSLVQMSMEWVVLLNPLESGSPMTLAQISVNTVLQGQTQHLYPVFLMTGGPQGYLSAFPSLGIELSLTPNASRQFSWALASLESTNSSFYAARKSTSHFLDLEQVKLDMLQKQQQFSFDFQDPGLNERVNQTQKQAFQLMLPAHAGFNHPSYAVQRLPDLGNYPSDKRNDYAASWGIQRVFELFEISRTLLPIAPDTVKGMLQNLLDQQGDDGTIFAQTTWNGHLTSLPAAPLLASMALELEDSSWWKQNYSSLVRSLNPWLKSYDNPGEGFKAKWTHLIQTGLMDAAWMDKKTSSTLDILAQCAEWPSLAALWYKECRELIKIADLIQQKEAIPWLEEKLLDTEEFLDQCWDEQAGFYHYRDSESKSMQSSTSLRVFKADGEADLDFFTSTPVRLNIRLTTKDQNRRLVECQIKGVIQHHEKKVVIHSRNMQWSDDTATVMTVEAFSNVKKVMVSGMKKGDQLIIETPDFAFRGPDFMIPLWAGIPDQQRAQKMIEKGSGYMDQNGIRLPLFLKIMWLEGLINHNEKHMASDYFSKWFLEDRKSPSFTSVNQHLGSVHGLIPIRIMLSLMGVITVTDNEVLIRDFNDFLPKVNVQYKKVGLGLEPHKTRIWALNGEQIEITQPGTHRIVMP